MKKSIHFLLALLCLYFTLISEGRAQNNTQSPVSVSPKGNGQISGLLTDSLTGKPLEYATVALLKKGTTQATDGTLTDNNGRFSFSNLSFGEYELNFSFIGYNTKSIKSIAITERNPAAVVGTVKIAPAARQLQEVNVTSLRPTIIQEADRMVVSVEGTALAAGRTAFDVLSKSPGVFVDQDGNVQLNGRGGVTIMLNNKLTYLSANDLRNMLEGMSAENIKNIEIITNPSARYDAEGSSGILNINLKTNLAQGVNGSFYAGYTYNFKQHAYTTGGNINYMSGRWNTHLIVDQMKRVGNWEGTSTRVFYRETENTYFDQTLEGKRVNQGPPVIRFGTDYSLNDRHSIGAVVGLNRNTLWLDFLTDTYLGSTPTQPEAYIEANNYTINTFTNFNTNLHYVGKLDTLGTSLTADLDFVKIANNGFANFYNYFSNLNSNDPAEQDFLFTDTENGFDIYSAKVDYTRMLKANKIELGAKVSKVVSDNDSRFYFNNSEKLVLDPNRTNHFVYHENIYAAYFNLNRKMGERYSVQAGLRAEQTASKGELLTTNQVTEREYLNLFPSLFVQQKVSDNYQISYSYSRRILRPNYGRLNPFILYRDPYTYSQGNPYLRAQYSHAFGITQTFRKDYRLVLNYQLDKDVISDIPVPDAENATTVYTTGNVDDSHNLSLVAIAPIKIAKYWDANNTLTVSYNDYRTVLNTQEVVNNQVFYMLQSNHNILLPHSIKMEVNAAYRGPAAFGLYRYEPMWWVHVGLRRSFLNKKLEANLNVNDVFKTYRTKYETRIGRNSNDFDQYFFSRNIGLTLRYNFSRGARIEERRRNNLEELNRL